MKQWYQQFFILYLRIPLSRSYYQDSFKKVNLKTI